MFQQHEPHLIIRALGAINFLTKSLNTIGSLFHAANLGIAHVTADPLHAPVDIGKAALDYVFKTKNSGITQAVEAFKNGGKDPAMEQLISGFIQNGLMLSTEDIKPTIIRDMGAATDRLLSKFAPPGKEVRAVQHITEPFDKHVLQRLNSMTWDYMHAGQKLNLATKMFTKAKLKNPEKPDAELMKEISKMVNETFGGLNWIDVANKVQNQYLKAFAMKATGIRGREWAQIMLFAPDWTISTLRSFTSALPKELAKPQNWQLRDGVKGMFNPVTQGDFARRYVLNTALLYFTIQNGIQMAFGNGKPIWTNKDPTRVELADGTQMQVAKHSMETAEWVRDPIKTVSNKLGFWPKMSYIEISGRAYPSPDAPKLKPAYEGYGGMEVAKAKAMLTAAGPFQLSAAVQAPEGEKVSRAIFSTLGFPKYGMTREERSAAQKRGKEEAKAKREEKKWESAE